MINQQVLTLLKHFLLLLELALLFASSPGSPTLCRISDSLDDHIPFFYPISILIGRWVLDLKIDESLLQIELLGHEVVRLQR